MVTTDLLRKNTPIENYENEYGIFVKREDLACPKPGPAFSKVRGVYNHLSKITERRLIGVLDTYHSQAGHAVAYVCQALRKECINYYPEYKYDSDIRFPQLQAKKLGAKLHGLPAGRSCILFHQARKHIENLGGYMMPNALKLNETVEETAKEVTDIKFDRVIIPASSGTIAAGVIRGFLQYKKRPEFVIHLGYSRSQDKVRKYLEEKSGFSTFNLTIIDERYTYRDQARPGEIPPWPCNKYYDLKAFRWWLNLKRILPKKKTLFWNIG